MQSGQTSAIRVSAGVAISIAGFDVDVTLGNWKMERTNGSDLMGSSLSKGMYIIYMVYIIFLS